MKTPMAPTLGTTTRRGWRNSSVFTRVLATVAGMAVVAGGSVALASPSKAERAPGKVDSGLVRQAAARPLSGLNVIIREKAPASDDAERLVRRLGGTVRRELSIIGSFSARVPASRIGQLGASALVRHVWGDAAVRMMDVQGPYSSVAANTSWISDIGLNGLRATGDGVTVAVLDTGIAPNSDLGSRLVYHASFAPDNIDLFDHFGHGTHLAGLVAGDGSMSGGLYRGAAPRAKVVSIKVAQPDGSTDVSVVIDGLQWAYQNRSAYNIRVLNLSFGTDGRQPYSSDPMDFAVEQVWKSGIVVVVSAGNLGAGTSTITKPGDDPYVITVGAAQLGSDGRYFIPDFSSRGPTQDGFAKPDLVAPGVGMISARCADCTLDVNYPAARVGTSYFKGSGTSQAAAVTSGVVALMLQASPSLTPDAVKYVLMKSATKLGLPGSGAGLLTADTAVLGGKVAGLLNVNANRGLSPSQGGGSLEGSRGSAHTYADLNGDGTPEMVTGEIGWDGSSWGGSSWGGSSWGGSSWGGSSWGGSSWGGSSWGGSSWGGSSWGGSSWGGSSWGGSSWGGTAWG